MYTWSTDQCERLWSDIVEITQDTTNDGGHFIGSLVYIESGQFQITSIPKLLLIDGQQRLTTISVLLYALANHIDENKIDMDPNSDSIKYYYLLNREEQDEDFKFKILLTNSDKETYTRLISGHTDIAENPGNLILNNYRFFQRKLSTTDIHPKEIFSAISRLEVVDVALDRRYDDPQLIFDSLNSTGVDLSEPDRIRNYILMGQEQEKQKYLYEAYWRPMEERFGRKGYDEFFHWFVRDYLTMKGGGQIPRVGGIYEAFKSYVTSGKYGSTEEIVQDMHKCASYYAEFALAKGDFDPEIKSRLEEIRSLNVTVSYPFLLELFDDYTKKLLSTSDLLAILNI